MPAYLIIQTYWKDLRSEIFKEYATKVPYFVEKHGGEYAVRGGSCEVIETSELHGSWEPTNLVIMKFPDTKSIHNFFNDPDYQPLKELRHRGSEGSKIVAVDGIG